MHWRRYLELDLGSPWAKIARAHLEEGAEPAGGDPESRRVTDVLLVGGGGREHALAWKLAQSPRLGRMIAAPGNPGIAAHARCVAVKDTAIDELVDLARRERPDLVVVGPEVPLALGLADRLRARRLRGVRAERGGGPARELEGLLQGPDGPPRRAHRALPHVPGRGGGPCATAASWARPWW